MKIIKLASGVGNQLFMYAFYRYIEKKYGDRTFFDDKYFKDQTNEQRHSELDIIFPNYPVFKCIMNPAGEIGVKGLLFNWFRAHFPICKMVYESEYDDSYMYEGDVYFKGFWQTEEYVKTLDRDLFIPKQPLPSELEDVMHRICNSKCSVAIHIRRGDYFKGPYASSFGVCTSLYFHNAMHLLEEMLGDDISYFVFTNDEDWVINNIVFNRRMEMMPNYDVNSFWYIYLMSKCHHNIISNSSFSWWGAYLNENKEKIVIGPNRWLNNSTFDLMLPSWVKVKVD